MKNQFLFYENTKRPVEVYTEQKLGKKQKDYFVQGIYMLAEDRNQNGRVYPWEILYKQAKIFQNNIKEKFRCTGELDHPDYAEIRHSNSAILHTELTADKKSKKYFYGKSKVLDPDVFPNAKKVIALIDEGIKFGMSTRGMGDIDSNGVIIDYQLITIDAVADPSAAPAIIEAIYENRNRFLKQGVIDLSTYNKLGNIKNNKYYKNVIENVDEYFNIFTKG